MLVIVYLSHYVHVTGARFLRNWGTSRDCKTTCRAEDPESLAHRISRPVGLLFVFLVLTMANHSPQTSHRRGVLPGKHQLHISLVPVGLWESLLTSIRERLDDGFFKTEVLREIVSESEVYEVDLNSGGIIFMGGS